MLLLSPKLARVPNYSSIFYLIAVVIDQLPSLLINPLLIFAGSSLASAQKPAIKRLRPPSKNGQGEVAVNGWLLWSVDGK